MSDAYHPIQMVAGLTGLSAHVIRIWEQRYQAVEPRRTPGNHRLYSAGDIERLSLLREVTRAGHHIGQVAGLTTKKLRTLAAASDGTIAPQSSHPASPGAGSIETAAWVAIQALDDCALDDALHRAGRVLGSQGVLHRFIAPLAQTLGDRWREGQITSAHEHFATQHLRTFLAGQARSFGGTPTGPVLVVATPTGQVHELGALLATATAVHLGWTATCLGASLPAAEIAGAARQKRARAVALSLVYPEDDASLAGELALLRKSLPEEVALLAGGRAMPAYREALIALGAILTEDLPQLGKALDRLRRNPAK